MLILKEFSRGFLMTALLFGCAYSAKSQADCQYGHRIHVRDASGATITKAKVDVVGLTETDKLPTAFQNFRLGGAYFVGFIMYGCSYPGHFLLRVSAEGFRSYERQITFTEGFVPCELRLQPRGSTRDSEFETLATLRGKIVDQEGQPFGGARIEAKSAHGRVYQDNSNDYGYYNLDLPNGVYTVRLTATDIVPIVFNNYRIEGKYTSLNVNVCLKCRSSRGKRNGV